MSTTQARKHKPDAPQAAGATRQDKRPATAQVRPDRALGAAVKNPGALGAGGMLALQAAAGNRAVAGLVQARRDPSSTGDSARVHEAARLGIRGGSGKLPYLGTIQKAFGRHDVMGVAAHTGAQATAGAQAMGAAAFATGNHVAFAGSPDLHTAAHEAAHVVQQRGGVQLSGGVGEVGDRYEQHADAVAGLVVQGRSAEHLLDQHRAPGASGASSAREGSPGPERREAIQRGQAATKASPVGRNFAVSYTKQFPKGTMGNLIHETVSPFASIFGDFASGLIGQHYKDRADVLAKSVTKYRVIRFAIEETRWWEQQPGLPGAVGALMSKRVRAAILLERARSLGVLPPAASAQGNDSKQEES